MPLRTPEEKRPFLQERRQVEEVAEGWILMAYANGASAVLVPATVAFTVPIGVLCAVFAFAFKNVRPPVTPLLMTRRVPTFTFQRGREARQERRRHAAGLESNFVKCSGGRSRRAYTTRLSRATQTLFIGLRMMSNRWRHRSSARGVVRIVPRHAAGP